MDDETGLLMAIDEARKGLSEGGVPIGAALISSTGDVLGRSHNKYIQEGSVILHAEMSTFNVAGHHPRSVYATATLYTTLTPCDMCTGACLWFGVKRVVMGEKRTVNNGGHDILKGRGVEVIDMNSQVCYDLLQKWIEENPEKWKMD